MTRPVRPVDFDIPDAGRTLFLGRVGSTRPTLIPPPKIQEIIFNVHLVSVLLTEIGRGFLDLSAVGYKPASPESHEVCCSSSACSHRVKSCNSRCDFSFRFRKPARWEISSLSGMSVNVKNLETLPCLVSRWGWLVL